VITLVFLRCQQKRTPQGVLLPFTAESDALSAYAVPINRHAIARSCI